MEASGLTVTMIDMSNSMRKQTRVTEATTNQSRIPVIYSYSVAEGSTAIMLPSEGFSGSEDFDIS